MTKIYLVCIYLSAGSNVVRRYLRSKKTPCVETASVTLDKTIKYLTYVAIPNSHNLHSTITEKLQKYTDLKEELIRIWQLNTACIIPLVLSTMGNITNKLHESLKLLNLRPALYILMQIAVILDTRRIVRKFLEELWVRSAWSVRPCCCERQLNCCEVRNVDDDDNDDNR